MRYFFCLVLEFGGNICDPQCILKQTEKLVLQLLFFINYPLQSSQVFIFTCSIPLAFLLRSEHKILLGAFENVFCTEKVDKDQTYGFAD